MSNILKLITNTIPSFFGKTETTNLYNKTLEDINYEHEQLINKIVNDIITLFMDNKNKDEYILELLEPTVCNDLTLYFTKDLEDKFKSYQIDKFQADISVSKEKHKPCTTRESCTKQVKDTIISSDPKVSKWELCYTVASHYVKMLNLLAALLTGISPEKNMCMERINAIYNVVDKPDGTQGFEINICKSEGKHIVKDRLFEENGLRELINLYILDHMNKLNTEDDFKLFDQEYKNLVKALNNSKLLTSPIEPYSKQENNNSNTTVASKKRLQQPEPKKRITKQESTTLSNKTNMSPLSSDSELVSKIHELELLVKKIDSNTKALKRNITPKTMSDIKYLKNKTSELTKLISKKNVSAKSVSNILSNYTSNTYSTSNTSNLYNTSNSYNTSSTSDTTESSNYSDYENELNSYVNANDGEPTHAPQQLYIYIGDAYDKLNEIKSSSESETQYGSNENIESVYDTSLSSSSNNTVFLENNNMRGGNADSLVKFTNFIKKYKEYWTPDVRKYFDALINNGFNSGAVNDICISTNANNKDIFIDIDDIYEIPQLTAFSDNFDDMKLDYINYCDKIIDILENDLLEVTKENKTVRYSFRNLSSDDLYSLQKKCRRILLEMYTNNHKYYLNGIGLLKRYFTSTFYKKLRNDTTAN